MSRTLAPAVAALILLAACSGSVTTTLPSNDGGQSMTPASAVVNVPKSVAGMTLSAREVSGVADCFCPDFPNGDGWWVAILRTLAKTPQDVEVKFIDPIIGDEFGFLDPKMELRRVAGTSPDQLLAAARSAEKAPNTVVEDATIGGLRSVVVNGGGTATRHYFTAVGETLVWLSTTHPDFAEAFFTALNPATPPATLGPTATPDVTDPLPIALKGEASADGQGTTELVQLAGGDYRMRWTVREPFEAGTGVCGVTIALYDSAGMSAGGTEGMSVYVYRPTSGQLDFRDLAAGRYEVDAYVGCPWDVTLDRP